MERVFKRLTQEQVRILDRIEGGGHSVKQLAKLIDDALEVLAGELPSGVIDQAALDAALADYLATADFGAAFDSELDAKIVKYESTAGAGGNATETMVVTGLEATDTILAVTQKTPGANGLAVVGYANQVADALDITYTADPGAGSVVEVLVKKNPA